MGDEGGGSSALGAHLRRARLAIRISQEELAERTGLSVRAIGDLERGRTRRPYPRTIRVLADALGIPDAAALLAAQAGDAEETRVVPRQLPAAVRHFVGRARERRVLDRLLDEAGAGNGAVVISAVGGTAGVGKTALALQWAHQVADRFPDGQLYVNLHGYGTGTPVSASDTLAGFLRALGVDGRDIPADEEARAGAYRSLLAGRRVLILVDNVDRPEQVRPLLPGTAGCAVLVTSRDSLAGLVARDGAVRLELDVLPLDASVALLRVLIGRRVDDDPRATAALAALCCRLPLALRVAAELAVARPAVPLAVLVTELADLQDRLDLLDAVGDEATPVRAAFSWSYRNLDPAAARAFRLAALHPGTDLDRYAVAALVETDPRAADRLLGRLARAHLVHHAGIGRYGMHDLLRGYAREQAAAEEGTAGCDAALTRLCDWYLHTAAAAMDTLFPAEASRRPRLAPFTGHPAPVAATADAQDWLDAERANLLAIAADAAGRERICAHAITLSATLQRYLTFGHHLCEAATMHRHALGAARRLDDRPAEARALSDLGFLEWEWGHSRRAADHQRRSMQLYLGTADRTGLARALHRLALAERHLGDLEAAAGHAGQVVALCRQTADRLGEARGQQSLALIRFIQGDFAQATALLHEVLGLLDALGDRRGRSVAVQALGRIELRYGRLTSAEGYLDQAAQLSQNAGNRSGYTEAISLLGLVRLGRGEGRRAIEHQQRALALYREHSDRHGEAEVLARLALAELRTGCTGEALAHLHPALDLARMLEAPLVEATVRNGLGESLLAAGQPRQALTHLTVALALARRTGYRDEQARAEHVLANTRTALGEHEQAYLHRCEALRIYRALGVPEAEELRDSTDEPPVLRW